MIHTKKLLLVLCLAGAVIFLNQVFSGRLLLPQTLSLGPLTIRYYGIIMALSVASGFYLAAKRSGSLGIGIKQAQDILFWIIVGGFVGARAYHVLSSFAYYQHNAIDIFKVWHGGLSIYGAVLGGVLAVFLLATSYKLPATRLLHWLTPSLILGQIIGRFGNLFNYEAFGYPTHLPWKMFVPAELRPGEYRAFSFFHPWFLYEQIGLLLIFFILKRCENRKIDPASAAAQVLRANLFLYYLLLYNILRFALEFLRIDSVFLYGVRQNAVVSFFLIILASILILYKTRQLGTKKHVPTS